MKRISICYDAIDRAEWDGEGVVALGDVRVDPGIPKERVLAVPQVEFVKPEKLVGRLPEEFWKEGLRFVMPGSVSAKAARRTLGLQLEFIARSYVTFFHDRPVNEIEPPLSAFLGALKDPSRSLSQLRNYPWLLRYPLADKLNGLGAGGAALILLAGPGLNRMLPRLPELARHCAVICIPRTLRHCIDAGVEPDFVVHYDTNMEQRQFYAGLHRLEKTVLVTLSSAHVQPAAGLFRGLFLRGSFGRTFLPNPFVLRDGVEGSLIACLGLTEALGSARVYLAGADLSWLPRGGRYAATDFGADAGPARMEEDVRARTGNGVHFRLGRRDGRIVESSVSFIAAAHKAGEAAAEIAANTGATFRVLGEDTLLSAETFPSAEPEEILGLPVADREALLAGLDRALDVREPLNLRMLLVFLRENTAGLGGLLDLFLLKRLNLKTRETLADDPVVRLLANLRGVSWAGLGDSVARAERLLRAWRDAYGYAARWALAHFIAARGGKLLLLCADGEEPELRRVLERLLPGCGLEVRRSTGLGYGDGDGGRFDDRDLPRMLAREELLLVSPGVMRSHAYFWELVPDDKVLDLRWLGPSV